MPDRNKLPTREEIDVYGCLDGKSAVRNFLGKDLRQAQAMFRDNFLYYQEGLMWMGPKAFCFYVDAAIDYLLSIDADGDSHAASSFCGDVEFRVEHDAPEIAPAYPRLHDAITKMLENFDRYDCDLDIEGDVKSRYEYLLNKLH